MQGENGKHCLVFCFGHTTYGRWVTASLTSFCGTSTGIASRGAFLPILECRLHVSMVPYPSQFKDLLLCLHCFVHQCIQVRKGLCGL